jgi:hypothetical protein
MQVVTGIRAEHGSVVSGTMMKRTFAAPWATSLKVISVLSTILLLTISWLVPLPGQTHWVFRAAVRMIPALLLFGCALFTVRGYEVADGWLNVRRLLWMTRIPLRTLTDAEWRRGSFGLAWRTCGNGGLFSFTGWYYQKSLGSFRALATRTSDAVILKFSDRKPIVVTPDAPAEFAEAIKATSTA